MHNLYIIANGQCNVLNGLNACWLTGWLELGFSQTCHVLNVLNVFNVLSVLNVPNVSIACLLPGWMAGRLGWSASLAGWGLGFPSFVIVSKFIMF